MKLSIGNNNFTDIGTAVFYTDADIAGGTYSKVQHKSNSSHLYEGDFSEYDFSYDVEKNKFNDEFKIDYVGEKTLSMFEKSSEVLEKLESVIFPTLGDETWNKDSDSEKYFGTTLIGNQVFALLHAEKGISRVELYPGIIERNNNSKYLDNFVCYDNLDNPSQVPYFVITLGIPREGEEYDPDIDLVREKELRDEVKYEKMIWLLITSNNEVTGINLSYRSWIDSINPNRNMNKYLLRNDEFFSTKDSIGITEALEDVPEVVIDANSGTLLSTRTIDIEKLLAFNKIKERVEKNKYSDGQKYPNYFPYVTYKTGDKVYYGGTVWESVSDNNFNSNPALSTKWVKGEVMEESRSIRIIVSVTPKTGGYCEPSGIISIPSIDHTMGFVVYPGPGYELNNLVPCLVDDNKVVPLPDKYFDYSVPDNLVIMHDWSEVIKTNKLVFYLKDIGSKLRLVAEYGGSDVIYPDWISTFNESDLYVYKMIESDHEGNNPIEYEPPYVDKSGEVDVTTGKKLEFYVKELMIYNIVGAELETEDGDSQVSSEVTENNETKITIPEVNFTSGTLRLLLSTKEVSATITEFSGFEVSSYSIKTTSGGPVEFKFIENEYYTDSLGNQVPKDYLDRVVLEDNQGNELVISRFTSSDSLGFGFSTVQFSRVNQPVGSTNYGEYTLRINNLYFDTTIKILRKDDTR